MSIDSHEKPTEKILLSGLSQLNLLNKTYPNKKSWPKNEHLCRTDGKCFFFSSLSSVCDFHFFWPCLLFHPSAHAPNTFKEFSFTYTMKSFHTFKAYRKYAGKSDEKRFQMPGACRSEVLPTDKSDFVDRAEKP
jgi:hypothetical protein